MAPKNPASPFANEQLLTFSQAVERLPEINGRRRAPSTLYRWCRHGINGVRLDYVRIGRTMATSQEAIERFLTDLTEADEQKGDRATGARQ